MSSKILEIVNSNHYYKLSLLSIQIPIQKYLKKVTILFFYTLLISTSSMLFSCFFKDDSSRYFSADTIKIMKNPENTQIYIPSFFSTIDMNLTWQASYSLPQYKMLVEEMSLWTTLLAL